MESLTEINKELRGILSGRPVTEDELGRVKASQTLRLPGSRETIDQVLGSIQELMQYNLPEDYHETYASKVRGLTLTDMAGSAKGVVQPDHMVWVVIGDKAKFEARVRELGLGDVRVLNPE